MTPESYPSPPRHVAPGGPVSVAIHNMRQAQQRHDMEDALAALLQHDPEADRYPQLLALREALAADIEARIAVLDAIDGDPDLEDGADDEPSLGAPEPFDFHGQTRWAAGGCDDRENAQCIDCDGEPTVFLPFVLGRVA